MIDIRFGYLFPWPFRLLAVIGILGALIMALESISVGTLGGSLASLAFLIASLFFLVSAEGTEVNMGNKTFREYTSYLFFKSGKFESLPQVEKIYITRSKESEKMHTAHTSHSSTFQKIVHNGYLKFVSGEKIHLMRQGDKDSLIQKLSPLSKALNVDIIDHS